MATTPAGEPVRMACQNDHVTVLRLNFDVLAEHPDIEFHCPRCGARLGIDQLPETAGRQ